MLRASRSTRRRIRIAAARVGLEQPARQVWSLLDADIRRDQRDTAAFRTVLPALIGPNGSCVDVGAHAGHLLAEVIRVAPAGRHVAIEPLPAFAEHLRQEHASVVVHQVAAWDEPGTAQFDVVPSEPGLSGLRTAGHQTDRPIEVIDVELAPLDAIVPPEMPVELIKLDVEGAELHALRGARELLARRRPALYFEHHHATASFGTTSHELHAFLTDAVGYRIFDMRGSGPYDRAAFAAAEGEHVTNFLALSSA